MDKDEARELLDAEMLLFREMSYAELQQKIRESHVVQRTGASGVMYTIEVEVFWDDPREPGGCLRVLGAIDDGRFLAALCPLSDDFIMDPEGNFIGE